MEGTHTTNFCSVLYIDTDVHAFSGTDINTHEVESIIIRYECDTHRLDNNTVSHRPWKHTHIVYRY